MEFLLNRDAGFINVSLLHFKHMTLGRSEHFFDQAFYSRITQDIIGIRCGVDLSGRKIGSGYDLTGVIEPNSGGGDRQVAIDV